MYQINDFLESVPLLQGYSRSELILLFITGRHRWVEYAEKSRYNASQVPAEWHGWLHYITDHTGDEASCASILI